MNRGGTMKIAYSCAGEGFGHVSRLVVLLPHLEKTHAVGLFLPKSIVGYLNSRLGPRTTSPIPGIHYVQRHDRVLLAASLLSLLPVIFQFPIVLFRLARTLKSQGYQAVISDYEPHLAWAAYFAGIPVLQLNHPGVLTRVAAQGILGYLGALGSRLMEGPWQRRILVSFFQGDVGPLLRPSLQQRAPKRGAHLVVNLKDSYRTRALAVLTKFPGLDYKLFPSKVESFDEALLDCAAVITPAGHQVIAEALSLNKPVLALPQAGQPEQLLNAQQLVATGRGKIGSLDSLELDLRAFLAALPELSSPQPLPRGFNLSDGTLVLLARIERFLLERVVG